MQAGNSWVDLWSMRTSEVQRAEFPRTSAPQTTSNRLYELDLARLVAAFAVVAYHYTFVSPRLGIEAVAPGGLDAVTRYGAFSVQFFFMLSGFVIALGRVDRSAKDFAINRVVRLYPTYWVAVAITGAVVLATDPSRWWEALVNATMLQDAFGVRRLDGSYWTLFVELKFYALFALVIASGLRTKLETILGVWVAITAAAFVFTMPTIVSSLLILQHSAFFIAGATIALSRIAGTWTPYRMALLVMSWGLALLRIPRELGALEQHWDEEFSSLVLALLFTSFFVIMPIVAADRLTVFRHRKFAILGAMSYPLYILHGTLGYKAFEYLPGPRVLLGLTVTIAMFVASYVIARWVEPTLTKKMLAALTR